VFFPEGKQPGHEYNHPHLSTAEIKDQWSCTSIFLQDVARENFPFTFTMEKTIHHMVLYVRYHH
jgi:hypothetical protein